MKHLALKQPLLKRSALVAALLATGMIAAEARPMSSAMRCADVQRLVRSNGAIVMNFTPTTYDRVVVDRRFCLQSEIAEVIYVPTRDTQQCFAGYTCRENDWPNW